MAEIITFPIPTGVVECDCGHNTFGIILEPNRYPQLVCASCMTEIGEIGWIAPVEDK